jgi:hypothetical protein
VREFGYSGLRKGAERIDRELGDASMYVMTRYTVYGGVVGLVIVQI